jgi:hypothetical protein
MEETKGNLVTDTFTHPGSETGRWPSDFLGRKSFHMHRGIYSSWKTRLVEWVTCSHCVHGGIPQELFVRETSNKPFLL